MVPSSLQNCENQFFASGRTTSCTRASGSRCASTRARRKAAKGRGKTYDQIHEVAQGRVWSGQDELRLGLVDEMGGLSAALRRALVMAHLDPEARVQLVVLPEAKSWFSQFWNGEETATSYAALRRRVRKLIEEGPSIEPDGVLSMPYVPVLR